MEAIFVYLQQFPWWADVSTAIVCASVVTAVLKDRYAEKIPFLGKLWPLLNFLSINIGHNENKPTGMGKEKGKK
jgi:hypothetical protein